MLTEQAPLVNRAIIEAGSKNRSARIHIDQLQLADVERSLVKFKPKRSAGPDGILAYIFIDSRDVLAVPMF